MSRASRRAGGLSTQENNYEQRLRKALAHPLRAQILEILRQGEASPTELSQSLSAPLGVTAYHVRRLADLELIALTRQTKKRGSIEHHYAAVPRR